MSSREKNLVIVRSVLDQGLTAAQAAAGYGVTRQWVHTLIRRYQTEGLDGLSPRSKARASRPGTTSEDADRIAALERENRELRRANTILKQASAFFAAEIDRPQR